MSDPKCPKCSSVHAYQDGTLWICPECAHEWTLAQVSESVLEVEPDGLVRDANGNILQDGDSVIVVKDLKIKEILALTPWVALIFIMGFFPDIFTNIYEPTVEAYLKDILQIGATK